MDTLTDTDPIDQLIPPPRPWWVRLVVGLIIVGVVGFVSSLIGFGYLYPRPECCGGALGGTRMTLTPDRKAVTVTVFFFNSSGRDLMILSASADLPGATVLDIAFDAGAGPPTPAEIEPLPAIIGGTEPGLLLITFVPDTCIDSGDTWGSVKVDLDVINEWLPSIDRTYTLPNPVVGQQTSQLSVLPPNDDPSFSTLHTPLAAACALLDAAST